MEKNWLVDATGRALLLRRVHVTATAGGGVAHSAVRAEFVNPYPEPLELTLHVPVPPDGAVSRCEVVFADRRIVGRVEPRAVAQEAYEAAILEGRLAVLLEEQRTSAYSLAIGNVPGHVAVSVEFDVDHALAWLSDGSWEWRFPTVVAPRYLGETGRVADAAKVAITIADDGPTPSLEFSLSILDTLVRASAPVSPSHGVSYDAERRCVRNSPDAHPDRDVVVRWPVATKVPIISVAVARPPADPIDPNTAYGLLTIVPPVAGTQVSLPRDVAIVIDASGSTRGSPLEQMSRIVTGIIDALSTEDTLEVVAFSSGTRRWSEARVEVSADARRSAQEWVEALEPGGATEMTDALAQVFAAPPGVSRRQVILVTDGLVGFENEVVRTVKETAQGGVRIHCVGVGPAVNRSLTAAVASAGGGVEVVVGLDEPVDEAIQRVVTGIGTPIVGDLVVSGTAFRELAFPRPVDVLPGAPARIPIALQASGGTIEVAGTMGDERFSATTTIAPCEAGRGDPVFVRAFARARVEALDNAWDDAGAPERDRLIERLGCDFQIATRLTSWFAVSEEVMVRPGTQVRKELVPQMLPAGLSVIGLGLRVAAPVAHGLPTAPDALVVAKHIEEAGRRRHDLKQTLTRLLPMAAALVAIALAFPAVRNFSGVVFHRLFFKSSRPSDLTGLVVSRTSRELIIEFSLGKYEGDWAPGSTAEVRFADTAGTTSAVVDLQKTTPPGVLRGGQPVRLALTFPSPVEGIPEAVSVDLPHQTIQIRLDTRAP